MQQSCPSFQCNNLNYILDWYNGKRMNQNAKPHKQFLVVGDQNGIRAFGLCRFVSEEFDHNNLTSIALYYGKIR